MSFSFFYIFLIMNYFSFLGHFLETTSMNLMNMFSYSISKHITFTSKQLKNKYQFFIDSFKKLKRGNT